MFDASFLRQIGQYQNGLLQFSSISIKPFIRHLQQTQWVTPNICPIQWFMTLSEGQRIKSQSISSLLPSAKGQSHLRNEKMPTRATYEAHPYTQFQFFPAQMSLRVRPITQQASLGTLFLSQSKQSWAKYCLPQYLSLLTTLPSSFSNYRIGYSRVVIVFKLSIPIYARHSTLILKQNASQYLRNFYRKILSNLPNGWMQMVLL